MSRDEVFDVSREPSTATCAVASGHLGWPRAIRERRWFALWPVRVESAGWRWLTTVNRITWAHRAGDWMFETRSYALLP